MHLLLELRDALLELGDLSSSASTLSSAATFVSSDTSLWNASRGLLEQRLSPEPCGHQAVSSVVLNYCPSGAGCHVASLAWRHAIEQTQLRNHIASMAWAPKFDFRTVELDALRLRLREEELVTFILGSPSSEVAAYARSTVRAA